MSDHWIALIPEDPWYVPAEAKQRRARQRFAEIAPEADGIVIKLSDTVQFFDCGQNFERICCPFCGLEVSVAWWQVRMEEDLTDGYKLACYTTPCCGKKCTMNDLVYEWPQGFGRFALDAMNPDIGQLKESHKLELEAILGTKLRVIHQHI